MAAVWALDVQRLCLLIATYSVYMGLGVGIHATRAAGLGRCGLCVCVGEAGARCVRDSGGAMFGCGGGNGYDPPVRSTN